MLKTAANEAAGKLGHRGVLFSYVEVHVRPRTKLEAVFSILSAVALAHDNIVCAEDRHDIGDHVAPGHIVERAHMNEGRGANLQAVGLPSAVADDVEPQLALGGLGPAVDLPLRGLKTLGEQLELLDHAGQVIEDLVLGG